MTFYLYQYTHRVSGLSYIGSTNNLERRRKQHAKRTSGAERFNRAVEKYGINAFDFRVLAYLDNATEAARIEQAAIRAFGTLSPNGFNLNGGAPYTQYNGPPCPETRQKMTAALHASPKFWENVRELNNNPEIKRRRAEYNASPKAQEHRAKLAAASKGKKFKHKIRLENGMYTPSQVSEMLGIPVSTLRRYSVAYAQHMSESARPARGKRHYSDSDILTLRKIRELVSSKHSPEDINRLLVIVDDHQDQPSALALLPDIQQAFEDIRSLLAQERSERERISKRLDELETWLTTPWYKRLGKKPPLSS